MMAQTTLCGEIFMSGVALHSGDQVSVTLAPAPVNHGIVFVSKGLHIEAQVGRVVDTQLATTLGRDGVKIRTVEHLLSTLMGLGVDNLRIEVDGSELPALDGCGAAWVQAIKAVGVEQQSVPKTILEMLRPVEVVEGNRWARIEPCEALSLDVMIDFEHPHVGRQHMTLDLEQGCFESELAWARTFGFERHVPAMRRMGLVRGGNLENALVFGETGPLNPGGLRRFDEPVRHKMLDVLGDLALLGSAVQGRVIAERPGHGLIVRLIREVVAQTDSWRIHKDPA